MKKTTVLLTLAFACLGHEILHAQGALTPPGAPAPTQKSLQEIWDKLQANELELQSLRQTVDALAPLVAQAVPAAPGMVTVQGGTLRTGNSLNGTVVAAFEIGRYEVRWDEWQEVRDWGLSLGGYFDFASGNGSAADHPVREVSWYDCVKYCNARSEREGLRPVYQFSGAVFRNGESFPVVDSTANGYRLPTQAEWEFAARGGVLTRGYPYAGSGILTHVGWSSENSSGAVVTMYAGRGTWPVGSKAANELGIHDMSGNVREWVEDPVEIIARQLRGGSFRAISNSCTVDNQSDNFYPSERRNDYGFRLARSLGN
jgi:formylglycine-generating enzyme required for sulfatase activity